VIRIIVAMEIDCRQAVKCFTLTVPVSATPRSDDPDCVVIAEDSLSPAHRTRRAAVPVLPRHFSSRCIALLDDRSPD